MATMLIILMDGVHRPLKQNLIEKSVLLRPQGNSHHSASLPANARAEFPRTHAPADCGHIAMIVTRGDAIRTFARSRIVACLDDYATLLLAHFTNAVQSTNVTRRPDH